MALLLAWDENRRYPSDCYGYLVPVPLRLISLGRLRFGVSRYRQQDVFQASLRKSAIRVLGYDTILGCLWVPVRSSYIRLFLKKVQGRFLTVRGLYGIFCSFVVQYSRVVSDVHCPYFHSDSLGWVARGTRIRIPPPRVDDVSMS